MNMKTVRTMTLVALAAAMPALAEDEINVSNGITTAGVPLGLHGVDAVALTSIHDVAEGSARHTVVVDGAAYYFASAGSAKRFEADPGRYLPRYGGFCAYAVAVGKKFDGDPRYADIVDGKLYLFVNKAIFDKYLENREEVISKADDTWLGIRAARVGDL
jgi:YHS domain-containing protein